MCGRYTLSTDPGELLTELGVEPEAIQPRFNIAPTQSLPVVRATKSGDGRELAYLRWGLVPSWAKDEKIGNRMINARSETAAEKPSFRSAMKRRRCLIPTDGFYEWKKEGSVKQPYHIHRADRRPFVFAGLWERWSRGEQPLDTFTILTTSPNPFMASLHDRMPVILPTETWNRWLDPAIEGKDLGDLLVPYPGDDFAATKVSRMVNSPANDRPACIDAIA
ncbi:MAG: SOS response-associated peptidase [Acidobacteriota bacterium]